MSGSLLEVLTENERRANRSCVLAGLWTAAVCALICLIGLTGAFGISRWWMCWYAGAIILPILAIAVYAKARDYRGAEVKHLVILGAALVPAGLSVPTLLGFFLMPLPIVVAGRYLSRRFIWETYLVVLVLTLALTVPHARFGVPCYPLCEEARGSLQLFLDGRFGCFRYWRYLVVHCYPSFAICLLFFAIILNRLCRDGQDALDHQAKVYARLADVEKGLAIAATMEVMREEGSSFAKATEDKSGNREQVEDAPSTKHQALSTNQPKVDTWSTTQIIKCISRCKARAAEDPEFAALVERDPAAAVREVEA